MPCAHHRPPRSSAAIDWAASSMSTTRRMKPSLRTLHALTLRAVSATGYPADADLALESDEILERLGVVSLPAVPLP